MDEPNLINNDARTAETLIGDLKQLRGVPCAGCRASLSHHQVLMAIAMGFKNAPRCVPCLAAALDSDPAQLRDSLLEYISRRQCYADAWEWANLEAGLTEGLTPEILHSLATAHPIPPPQSVAEDTSAKVFQTDAEWDAGDMACGELVLELRVRLLALPPGKIFKLSARDLGAPEDVPAWCRLTGHRLLRAEPPTYWIQRKEE